MNHSEQNKALWDSRADMGLAAGTNDIRAKKLEMRKIASEIQDGMKVLDVGCGNGIMAVELARTKNVHVVGIDHSVKMIEAAKALAANTEMIGTVEFREGDILDLPDDLKDFDVAYTERTLVNLSNWDSQVDALREISKVLRVGGRYLMVECSRWGLTNLNDLRKNVGLPEIVPPEHTTYVADQCVSSINNLRLNLEAKIDFTSTYYFISRVINAWQAQQLGQEPSYDDPVNSLADVLPHIGNCGQVRMWIWRAI